MLGQFYKNTAFVAFGTRFFGKTPIEVFYHFKAKSPLYTNSTIFEYFKHLEKVVGAPKINKGESAEAYSERVFHYLISENIVVFEGSDQVH